jgi:uncharacterized protein
MKVTLHESVDRTPLEKPTGRPAGYQSWQNLTFIHWPVPVAQLRPLIPARLEIDTWDGMAWLGLVAFEMRDIRPWWTPAVPYISNFAETNLRTYVHYRGGHPGVWFFSLDASRWLAVMVAYYRWRLNYRWSRMQVDDKNEQWLYKSRRIWDAGHHQVDLKVAVDSSVPAEAASFESFEYFLCERYLLYTLGSQGRLLRGQVHHSPYPLLPTRLIHCQQDITNAIGCPISQPPHHVTFSPGVKVNVFDLKSID